MFFISNHKVSAFIRFSSRRDHKRMVLTLDLVSISVPTQASVSLQTQIQIQIQKFAQIQWGARMGSKFNVKTLWGGLRV